MQPPRWPANRLRRGHVKWRWQRLRRRRPGPRRQRRRGPSVAVDDPIYPAFAFLDQLTRGMAEGKIQLVSIRTNVCGKCKEGTAVGSPTPSWMNRTVCDKCGHKA